MRIYSQLGAIILASMASFMAVAERVPTSDSDSLLEGPLGLVWLESQESMVSRGLVSTMDEFFDFIGEYTNKDRSSFPSTDPSCFQYEGCYTLKSENLGGLFNAGRFLFEDNQLVSIHLLYYVRVNETDPEISLTHIDPLYQSLFAELSSKYELDYESDQHSSFKDDAVGVYLGIEAMDSSPGAIGMLDLVYHFDIEEYQAILAKRALDKKVSEAGL